MPTRQWVVSPVPGTANETLMNGEALTAPRLLRQGDRIAVGRQAKGRRQAAALACAATDLTTPGGLEPPEPNRPMPGSGRDSSASRR